MANGVLLDLLKPLNVVLKWVTLLQKSTLKSSRNVGAKMRDMLKLISIQSYGREV